MADTKQQWYKDAKYGLFIHWGLYSMDTIRNSLQALATGASAQEVGDDIVDKMSAYE